MAPIENVGNLSIETFNEIVSAGVSSKLIYEGSICDSYPCLNDGICIDLFNQTSSEHGRAYKCLCGDMFQGHDCELRIPPINCTFNPCTYDPLCLPPLPCLPMLSQSNCTFNPCLNGGVCLLFPDHPTSSQQRCVCPNAFHGIFCESFCPKNLLTTSMSSANQAEWSALQSVFFFRSFDNTGSYPSSLVLRTINEYEVGNQYFLEDDLFGCDDEDLIGGVQMFKEFSNRSMSDLSQQCSMEMKTKPSLMKVSSTAESFITYDAKMCVADMNSTYLQLKMRMNKVHRHLFIYKES